MSKARGSEKVKLSHRYRVYPSREQKHALMAALDSCRWLYNYFLEQMREPRETAMSYGWMGFRTVPSRYDLQSQLPKLKQEHSFLAGVNSKVLQMVLHQLYSNLRVLSRLKKNGRKVGLLRFKGRGWYKTMTYNQSGFKFQNGRLWLSKIGGIAIKMHRPLRGRVKQVKIKREQTGRWYAIASVMQEQAPMPRRWIGEETKTVGIDLGIGSYAVDTSGQFTAHPRNIQKAEGKLAREQRRLSRKQLGSRNRERQRLRVARLHERVVNRRRDFLHKLSRYYVDAYSFIAVEDLDARGMMEEAHNARNHADSSWRAFLDMLWYKAENAGARAVKVPSRGTSQDCSLCNNTVPKPLWERTHSCPYCGFTADRDYNAALNILKRAPLLVGTGRAKPNQGCLAKDLAAAEFTPVNTAPLQERHVPASAVVEAGSSMRSVE